MEQINFSQEEDKIPTEQVNFPRQEDLNHTNEPTIPIDERFPQLWDKKELLQDALRAIDIQPYIGHPSPTRPGWYDFEEVGNIEILQSWTLGQWLVSADDQRRAMEQVFSTAAQGTTNPEREG